MDGVIAQQMRIGLDRAEVVDADNLDVLAAGLGDSPQDVAADAAKTVNTDADCHVFVSFNDRSMTRVSMTLVIPQDA